MPDPDRPWLTLGGRFWSDPRVARVVEELRTDEVLEGELPAPLTRLQVLFAAEDASRAAVEQAVAEVRDQIDASWQTIADTLGLSQSATMERYHPEYRRKAAERHRSKRRR